MRVNPVLDQLQKRRATRAIKTVPMPIGFLEDLAEAARLTPSCGNNQPWRFLFCESVEARAKASEAFTGGNAAWAPRAPLIVIGYANRENDCQNSNSRNYYQFDLGMSVMSMMLCATAMGLVARPMAGFKPEVLKANFEFAEGDEPFVMLAVGYPAVDDDHVPDKYKGIEEKPRVRKPVEEIVRFL